MLCWVGVRAGSPGRKGSSSRSLVPPVREASREKGEVMALLKVLPSTSQKMLPRLKSG
ncbi:hypothetical protein D3C84_968300 [compost metagenome]